MPLIALPLIPLCILGLAIAMLLDSTSREH